MSDDSTATRALYEELTRLSEHLSAGSSPEAAEAGARFQHVLETLRVLMIEIDSQGRIVHVSPTVRDILGYEPDELLAIPDLGWVHPEDIAVMRENVQAARETGEQARMSFRARHKQGDWIWFEVGPSIPIRKPDGRVHNLSFSRDITLRKRAQEALVESEERFRALAENASDLITEIDSSGRVVYVSRSCRRLLGLEPEVLMGQNLRESPTPPSMMQEDRDALLAAFTGESLDEDQAGIEWRYLHPDGSWRWFESKASSFWRRGNSRGTVVIARDITAHVRGRQDLQKIEERYRLVAQASGDVVSEWDDEGRMVWVSPTCEAVLGWKPEELVGTSPFGMLLHGDDVIASSDRFLESLASDQPVHGSRVKARHKNGSWRWLEITGLPFRNPDGEPRYLAVARDVTERVAEEEERRQLEQRMVQAQKLEGLGIMAGGVAHDFNNLLTPILGHASLALLDLPVDSPVRARLQGVQRAAHRAAALTQQMLSYTGTGPFQVGPVNLSDMVREVGELIESAASGGVEVDYRLAPSLPATDADSSQLTQVVMNLITNAVEAVGEGGGQVVIRTGVLEGELDEAPMYGELESGRAYVWFEVEDDGCGMDEETLARIFDPFFTTKFTGRGLGLAAVLGIVRGHAGAIELDTEAGRGTRFRVVLPSTVRQVAVAPAPVSTEGEWQSQGLVLVVDDDEAIRELAGDTLEMCGFTVFYAGDGREAVELFQKNADDVRLVLLDRTMPVIGGSEALDRIRRIRKDARVVLMSGYSHERAVDELSEGLAGFIQKPFLPMTLIEKVREALGE